MSDHVSIYLSCGISDINWYRHLPKALVNKDSFLPCDLFICNTVHALCGWISGLCEYSIGKQIIAIIFIISIWETCMVWNLKCM